LEDAVYMCLKTRSCKIWDFIITQKNTGYKVITVKTCIEKKKLKKIFVTDWTEKYFNIVKLSLCMSRRHTRGAEVQLHSLYGNERWWSPSHAAQFVSRERTPWVGHRVSPDFLTNRRISCLCQKSNPRQWSPMNPAWLASQEIPTYYETHRYITAFTGARDLSLSLARAIQSIPPHPTFWRSISILPSHLHLGLPNGSLHQVSAPKPCMDLSLLSKVQTFLNKILNDLSRPTRLPATL